MQPRKCRKCGQILPLSAFKKAKSCKYGRSHTCKVCHNKVDAAIRLECLIHYSGNPPFCVCCGQTRIEFLAIDHIHSGGTKHRKQIGESGQALTRWLKRNGFPLGFRTLCHDCNTSLGLYGYCPHQRERDLERQKWLEAQLLNCSDVRLSPGTTTSPTSNDSSSSDVSGSAYSFIDLSVEMTSAIMTTLGTSGPGLFEEDIPSGLPMPVLLEKKQPGIPPAASFIVPLSGFTELILANNDPSFPW